MKNIFIVIILFASILLTSCCRGYECDNPSIRNHIKQYIHSTIYFQNPKSKVCYSVYIFNDLVNPERINPVECTPEVKALLIPLE